MADDRGPAGELREAANRMRELAQAATPGPWSTRFVPEKRIGLHPLPARHLVVNAATNVADGGYEADAGYIASVHPDVALPLADLLEAEAGSAEQSGVWLPDAPSPLALAVARAYLNAERAVSAQLGETL
jgi:hypothetical protein